jgi:O-antigen ligase
MPNPENLWPRENKTNLYALRLMGLWHTFRRQNFPFLMLCCYFFVEYVRPQSIIPEIDILPWATLFSSLAFIGWAADPRRTLVRDTAHWIILLFFLIVLASSLNAYYPDVSFKNLEYIYVWVAAYFLIVSIVDSSEKFFLIMLIFLAASFKISLGLAWTWAGRGFAFEGWGLMGPPGFFENSGELAIQMAVYWPLAYAVLVCAKPFLPKWKLGVLYLMPITAALVILGSSSRGGQLALLVQLMLFFFFNRATRIRRLVLAAILAVGLWQTLPNEQKDRFMSAGSDVTSVQRLLYWERGVTMLSEHPLLGVGYFNFAPYFAKHFSEDLLVEHAQLPHNIFVQVGSELGYSGLFAYVLLIFYAFILGRKISYSSLPASSSITGLPESMGRAMNISLMGFIIAGQFVSVVYYPFLWIHLAFLVSLKNAVLKEQKAFQTRVRVIPPDKVIPPDNHRSQK